MQATVLWITILLVVILAAIFYIVIRSSTGSASSDKIQKSAGLIRQLLFWGALVVGIVVLYVTLRPWPHSLPGGEPIIVNVTGAQWSWEVQPETVPVGQPIVFATTSTDVNHGIGIYDQNMTLVAQSQSMPGWTNRVEYTFTEPGTYRILCLEYCGLNHHEMMAEITATQGTPTAQAVE